MRRSREIGWSNAEILLYELEKGPACYCTPSTTTTTSTTVAPCQGPDCDTNLIVGQFGNLYGYKVGEFGSLDSACLDLNELSWNSASKQIVLVLSTCFSSIVLQIDGQEFTPVFDSESLGLYTWRVSFINSSPFAAVNYNSIIRICTIGCTTTTTTTLPA